MKTTILIPVYNDWDSLLQLQTEIRSSLNFHDIRFLIVSDGSTEPVPTQLTNLTIIHLNQNLGHQRAIATGLCYMSEKNEENLNVIVMDSDGEDRPEDIQFLHKVMMEQNEIVFAQRARRHEGLLFKSLYICYRILFRFLTGRTINFGNFCAIPHKFLKPLVHSPFLWNHFSGSIIRSRIPYTKIKFDRGQRYFGKSKMNLVSLVLHGLSAIAIFIDIVSVRIMLACGAACAFIIAMIVSIVSLRLTTDFFVSGWTSLTLILLLILLAVIFLFALLICMSVLISRNNLQLPPILFYKQHILSIEEK